jgi:isopropylmalate/homocitrate/citramalate synthase
MNRLIGTEDVLEIFPFHWDFVGQKSPEVVLGKHSGSNSIENWLSKIGVEADEEQIQAMLDKVKALAYKNKAPITLDDFRNIVTEIMK